MASEMSRGLDYLGGEHEQLAIGPIPGLGRPLELVVPKGVLQVTSNLERIGLN
jgi:hypothetical protein